MKLPEFFPKLFHGTMYILNLHNMLILLISNNPSNISTQIHDPAVPLLKRATGGFLQPLHLLPIPLCLHAQFHHIPMIVVDLILSQVQLQIFNCNCTWQPFHNRGKI